MHPIPKLSGTIVSVYEHFEGICDFFSKYMNIFKFQQSSANQLPFYTLTWEEWVSFAREVGCEFSFPVLSFMIFMEINFNIEITDKITTFFHSFWDPLVSVTSVSPC